MPADTSKPPAAEPGFKWVRNGYRWNKVPVEQNAGIDKPEAQEVKVDQTKVKTEFATEPLGYEKEGVEGMYVTHTSRAIQIVSHIYQNRHYRLPQCQRNAQNI